MSLIDWTFEGFSGGPIRTFLHLYGAQYDDDLDATPNIPPKSNRKGKPCLSKRL